MTAGQSRKIWLTRHGESCFNMAARIGGDSGLTARGEEYARLLPDVLESRLPAVSDVVFVLCCHSTAAAQHNTADPRCSTSFFQWRVLL
jgi:broad specificity phosphatase PhoE